MRRQRRCTRVVRLVIDTVLAPPPAVSGVGAVTNDQVAARAGVYREPLGEVEIGLPDGGLPDGEVGLTAVGMDFRSVRDDLYVCVDDPGVTMHFHDADGAVTIAYPLFWQAFYGPDP